MGPIWDPSGQPAYGLTHMGPMPSPVALPIWDPYRHVCWVPAVSHLHNQIPPPTQQINQAYNTYGSNPGVHQPANLLTRNGDIPAPPVPVNHDTEQNSTYKNSLTQEQVCHIPKDAGHRLPNKYPKMLDTDYQIKSHLLKLMLVAMQSLRKKKEIIRISNPLSRMSHHLQQEWIVNLSKIILLIFRHM